MILVFGGAFQGKYDFAKENFPLQCKNTFDLKEKNALEFCSFIASSNEPFAVNHFEMFVKYISSLGEEDPAFLNSYLKQFSNSIIVCSDETQGVVPVDKQERAYRELLGRTLAYLGKEADEVYRVFCGLSQRIK